MGKVRSEKTFLTRIGRFWAKFPLVFFRDAVLGRSDGNFCFCAVDQKRLFLPTQSGFDSPPGQIQWAEVL